MVTNPDKSSSFDASPSRAVGESCLSISRCLDPIPRVPSSPMSREQQGAPEEAWPNLAVVVSPQRGEASAVVPFLCCLIPLQLPLLIACPSPVCSGAQRDAAESIHHVLEQINNK